LNSGSSYNGGWSASNITSDGAFVKAYITSAPVAVLPSDESKFQQRAIMATSKGLLTEKDKKSVPIYTLNGVRCSAGGKLANGLHIIKTPGNSSVKVINVVQ
jgi:hypothetical protein